jgi:hypothetical protein
MKLDDLQMPKTAEVMANLLKKHHGIQIPVDKITGAQAGVMLENVQKKLNQFRNTHESHVAEKNSNYLALLMVEQTLKTVIKEDSESPAKIIGKAAWAATKGAAGKIRRQIPGQSYGTHHLSATDVVDRFKTAREKDRGSQAVAGTRSVDALNAMANASDIDPRTIQSIVKSANRNPKKISPQDAEMLLNIVTKTLKQRQLSESVDLMESSVGEAEVVLAAKDMVDRVQDMVETLGKMVNEELPALSETIRDTMSPEQAESFVTSATDAINAALENIRETKNSLDSATRALAGEEPLEPEPTDDGVETAPELGTDETGSEEVPAETEPAEMPKPEPMGRAKR